MSDSCRFILRQPPPVLLAAAEVRLPGFTVSRFPDSRNESITQILQSVLSGEQEKVGKGELVSGSSHSLSSKEFTFSMSESSEASVGCHLGR